MKTLLLSLFNYKKNMALLVLVISAVIQISCHDNDETVKKPNIIYILADDMGYGDISRYNPASKIITSNLDQLANEGMLFTDAHTSSSVCTPTRYGILTGRYNWRSKLKSGVLTGKSKALIPNERTTVASLLQDQNYQTAFIGKWHLGWDWSFKNPSEFGGEGWDKIDFDNIDFTKPIQNGPKELGFDYSYGHAGSLDMAPYVYVENGMVTGSVDKVTINTGKYSWWREGPTANDFEHDDVTPNFFRRANKYIKEHAKKEDPFFLYLALPSPHTPILPTEEWENKSQLNPYADFVLMIDDYIGKLMEEISAAGIEDNTILIFTTDNGCSPAAGIEVLQELGHFPSHVYRGHKADIYEGGHRVPFLVKWPNKIKANSQNNQLICTTDLLATVADLVDYNLQENEGEDSFSLLPLLLQKSDLPPQRKDIIHHSINGNFAIRKGKWKLIMTPGSGGWSFPNPRDNPKILKELPAIQLYDLATDTSESINLQESESEIVKELKSLLIHYLVNGRSTEGPKQENDPIDFEWQQIDFIK